MAITFNNGALQDIRDYSRVNDGTGFFSKLGQRFIEGRMRSALAGVNTHLGHMDDSALKACGMNDEEIAAVRKGVWNSDIRG